MSDSTQSSAPESSSDSLYPSFVSGAKFGAVVALLTVLVVKLGASV